MSDLPPNLRGISFEECIVVKTLEGKGLVGNPARRVTWVFDRAGLLLAWHDPEDLRGLAPGFPIA